MPPKEKILLKCFGGAVLVIACVTAVFVPVLEHQIRNSLQLRDSGSDAVATIIATQCSNHGQIYYTFKSNAGTINAHSTACSVPCAFIRPGDTLAIRYLSQHPDINECGFSGTNIVPSYNGFIALGLGWIAIGGAFAMKCLRDMEALSASNQDQH